MYFHITSTHAREAFALFCEKYTNALFFAVFFGSGLFTTSIAVASKGRTDPRVPKVHTNLEFEGTKISLLNAFGTIDRLNVVLRREFHDKRHLYEYRSLSCDNQKMKYVGVGTTKESMFRIPPRSVEFNVVKGTYEHYLLETICSDYRNGFHRNRDPEFQPIEPIGNGIRPSREYQTKMNEEHQDACIYLLEQEIKKGGFTQPKYEFATVEFLNERILKIKVPYRAVSQKKPVKKTFECVLRLGYVVLPTMTLEHSRFP